MSLRARLFIIISLVVLFVLGISLILLARNRQGGKTAAPTAEAPASNGVQNTNANGVVPQNPAAALSPAATIPPISSLELEQNSVKQLAKVFIERYGTYSSDNNFQNLREVESLAAPELWKKISARMSTPAVGPFVGETVKTFSVNMLNWSDTAAELELKTLRTTEKGGVVAEKYQGVKVKLIKQGGAWLVSNFEWETP